MVSPLAAAAVAILVLLVGLWLAAAAVEHGAAWSDRPGWYPSAGWVLVVLATMLLLLAVPTAGETAPAHRRSTASTGSAADSSRPPGSVAPPRGPG